MPNRPFGTYCGAAAFAAVLSRRYQPKPGERVGVLVCGANTTAVNFQ
jgi:threonine dehydratase